MSQENPGLSRPNNKSKDLSLVFNPQSVAVIGASANPDKIGYQILRNIVGGGYAGKIYPIHPKEKEILGHPAYPSVVDVPGPIDFAVIAIPAPIVLPTLKQCAQKGIRGVIVITSGFAEVGKIQEEKEIKDFVDENQIALLGPNTLGIVYTPSKLNASFGPQEILQGKIAFISQSGALAISLMGWTMMERIGLASLVSLGNKADVDEKELIEFFNHDKNVDVIVIYMEGVKDGRKFLRTQVKKPVVILKVGCSQRGAKAAASHTGSLSGADKIYDAAFKQLGILRAKTFTEAFAWSRALSLPAPQGDEAVIITNGGGIGVSATDACEGAGIPLLEDPAWLEQNFRKTMPDFGSTKNPIDITGQGHGAQYREATRIALLENRIKTVIVLYCETAVTNPMEIAQAIEEEYQKVKRSKPMVVAMVGGERSREALHYLNERQIPSFSCVNEAISALKIVYTWRDVSRRPQDSSASIEPAPSAVVDFINKIKAEGRNILLEHEARKVMELCGVPTPKWGFAANLEEALQKAEGMYPLAMKVASPDIIHKTDVGGVVLNIRSAEELKLKFEAMMKQIATAAPKAYVMGVNLIQMISGIECIIGLTQDPQFGPVVMFGLGGVFVEALKDVSFRIVPFGKIEAERLLQDIQARKILDGFRGIKAHQLSIIQTLCAIQKLAPYVKEIDINPLVTNQSGSYAVDARIIL
ncbi:MAG: acetate--CoA ligase family protein [Candidatus Omnitrophota bacterium]